MSFEYPLARAAEGLARRSGSRTERLVFNHRASIVLLCLAATLIFAWQALNVALGVDLQKMVPQDHPYIVTQHRYHEALKGQDNVVRIAVQSLRGSVFSAEYLELLRRINDDVFLIDGVDRAYMKSLWTPATRWFGVTEEGIEGGPVIPPDYDGSQRSLEQVRINVERSGEVGRLVSADYRSTVIIVPLLDRQPQTGAPLDYQRLADALETLRAKYESDGVMIGVTGRAKVFGDLIDGVNVLLRFFLFTALAATAVMYAYTRSARSTLLVLSCAIMAVVWLLGLLPMLGYALDPYSVLVPFLILAIGMSHGAQFISATLRETGRGNHRYAAARYAFRRLFPTGLTALATDAVGLAALMLVPIVSIRELAVAASLGVIALIVTQLVLLPVLLSYAGLGAIRAETIRRIDGKPSVWSALGPLTERRPARVAVVIAALLAAGGLIVGARLEVGQLHPGAPELRPDSRYNRDHAFLVANYGASSDNLVVLVPTPAFECARYRTLTHVDALEWRLQQLSGVTQTRSLAGFSKHATTLMSEGYLKWYDLPRTQATVNAVVSSAPSDLVNRGCDLLSINVYLRDHRAATIDAALRSVEAFALQNAGDAGFLLAAGNAGTEAATNMTVRQTGWQVLIAVYIAVVALCFVEFRSWRAVVCAAAPLVLISLLCQALMVALDIGVTVATLPIVALGAGIGVDYALYVLAMLLARLREGNGLQWAYRMTLASTGRVVMLMAATLSLGVVSWAFSPIKFQADMGVLLAFTFLGNMLGALVLLPALAHFLLKPPAQGRRMYRTGGAI